MGANLDYKGNNFAGSTPLTAWLSNGATRNFIGNYSGGGNIIASYAPPAFFVASICALQILLSWDDAAATPIDFTKYGKLAALGTGMDISATVSGSTITILPSPETITTNGDFFGQQLFTTGSGATTGTTLIATIPFTSCVELNGSTGDSFNISLIDNFTGLAAQRFQLLGNIGYITV